mgnify:CR=1 FL=1
MNKFFYAKLALNNIKKNARTYIPYILTCIGTIIMFYNMSFLSVAKDISIVSDSSSVRELLRLGTIVIGIFSLIFLFYTNSFLIKRRKKEFGLFNILGMEKKHVARIMGYETIFTFAICLTAGISLGILLSKFMILLLFKIISFKATFGFEISPSAVLLTVKVFGGIFAINLVYNILQVHVSKPVELLKGGNAGEKEPKTKWITTIIGAVCLGIGYYIAIFTKSPLDALTLFFVAVILVMIGTYCLFTSGSIAVLKMLRRNKKYYYKPNHFISVSGMMYRMKQNAAGLANICILSTAVIIMISTTISLYVGMEEVMQSRYPRNILVLASHISDDNVEELDSLIQQQVDEAGVEQKNADGFRYMVFGALQDGASFKVEQKWNMSHVSDMATLIFITEDEYNKSASDAISLMNDEALLYTIHGIIPGDELNFNGCRFSVKERPDTINLPVGMTNTLSDSYCVVVKDTEAIDRVYDTLVVDDEADDQQSKNLSYYYGFDVEADEELQIELVKNLNIAVDSTDIGDLVYAEGAEDSRAGFYSVYGGLFYIGIFLGLLFVMATVLIIYYKQIAEGYDDKDRFEIMQKVGMSHGEIKKAVQSQVLTVFFMPLAAAVIHIAVAFNIITKLLAIFNLTDIPLFAACTAGTIIIFGILYTAVYALTATAYYKIVS